MTREQIYAELFRRVTKAGPGADALYRTMSRLLLHWDDVPPESQPALFQAQISEECLRVKGLPSKWLLRLHLFIYVNSGPNPEAVKSPAELLNPLLDAIEVALAPDDQDNATCTLGGLVSHCWISGTIETFEGTMGSQEVAIVPIEILVPSLR